MAARYRLLFACVVASFALPACHRRLEPAQRETISAAVLAPPPVIHETTDAGAPIDDTMLSSAIREAILRDPVLRSQGIHASVANGDVTLDGSTRTLAAKTRAAELIEGFKGVSGLTNRIAVDAWGSDADITKAVTDAIHHDPAVRSAKVRITCEADVVTIRGSADSTTQRDVLAEVASRVRGVRQVVLAVKLSRDASRGDTEIAADIRDRLLDDAELEGAHITVEVRDRRAALSGVAGSLAQRNAAMQDAWVAGVTDVDSSALRIDWRANDRARVDELRPVPTDDHVAGAVRRALSNDVRVGVQLPSVAVDRGVVTLSGTVIDFRAVKAADRDARRVFGVARVDDRMAVLPAERQDDATIERQVESSVYNDVGAPDSPNIQMTTDHARVTLDGSVATPEEKAVIEGDVEEVPGVVAVDNDLHVVGYGSETHVVSPQSIRDRAIEKIFWDPRVGAGKVTVAVASDGDVTLTGTVDSWGERQAARDDATLAGAAHVVDHVRVGGAPSPPAAGP